MGVIEHRGRVLLGQKAMEGRTRAEGYPSIFSLNYVQIGNDSQALSSGTFPLAGTRPGIWSWE